MFKETHYVEIKQGKLMLTFTDGGHCCVSSPGGESFTINRVEYHLGACHFFKWSDGSWQLGEESKGTYERGQNFYMSRVGAYGNNAYPSFSARDKAIALVLAFVQGFVAGNPKVLLEAEYEARFLARANAAAEVEKAQEALEAARTKYRAASDALIKAAVAAEPTNGGGQQEHDVIMRAIGQ